jgi:hypothetical protein
MAASLKMKHSCVWSQWKNMAWDGVLSPMVSLLGKLKYRQCLWWLLTVQDIWIHMCVCVCVCVIYNNYPTNAQYLYLHSYIALKPWELLHGSIPAGSSSGTTPSTVPAFMLQTSWPKKLCIKVQHSFIYICSTQSNLQLTSQFFYMMDKMPGINSLQISQLISYARSSDVHTLWRWAHMDQIMQEFSVF